MQRRRVAEPHGAFARHAGPVAEDALLEVARAVDAVERREIQVGASASDVEQERDELLALFEVAEPAQGRKHVIRVAQPAVAIVPGAPATR